MRGMRLQTIARHNRRWPWDNERVLRGKGNTQRLPQTNRDMARSVPARCLSFNFGRLCVSIATRFDEGARTTA